MRFMTFSIRQQLNLSEVSNGGRTYTVASGKISRVRE